MIIMFIVYKFDFLDLQDAKVSIFAGRFLLKLQKQTE